MGVGGEQSGSRGHGGGGRRAVVLEPRIDKVGVGDNQSSPKGCGWVREERSGLGGHGGGGARAVVLKLTQLGRRQAPRLGRVWWKREMNSCTRMDTVGSETSNRAREEVVR